MDFFQSGSPTYLVSEASDATAVFAKCCVCYELLDRSLLIGNFFRDSK